MNNSIVHKFVQAEKSISDFVYGFSMVQNICEIKEAVLIPNGRIDLFLVKEKNDQFHMALIGLETIPKLLTENTHSTMFGINFNPLAAEYVFSESIADILNSGKTLANDFWGFCADDMNNFDSFCKKASEKIYSYMLQNIDERKRTLFDLIFSTNGESSVKELSEKVFWSARQINQYFHKQFGLSLKTYCNILRFQASLAHIKAGQLFPMLNYYDQSHFIKEVKRLSGASPKELYKNQNSRFLQFLMIES